MQINPGIYMKGGGGTVISIGGLGACYREFWRFLCHERACGAI